MGTDCAPLLANLFLFRYEFKELNHHILSYANDFNLTMTACAEG